MACFGRSRQRQHPKRRVHAGDLGPDWMSTDLARLKTAVLQQCKQCHGDFIGEASCYCSEQCQQAANRDQVKKSNTRIGQRRAAARSNRTCARCGKAINAARSTRCYCSNGCRVAAWRSKHKEPQQ
jgi:hypothetical protein